MTPKPGPPGSGRGEEPGAFALGPARGELAEALAALAAAAGLPAWSPEAWADEIARPGSAVWVAGAPSGPLRALAVLRTDAREAELLALAVAPGCRRRGLAGRLWVRLREEARRRGASAVFLEVRAGNAPARGFYRSQGFVEVGRRPRYYPDGEDAVLMRHGLTAEAPRTSSPGAASGKEPSGIGNEIRSEPVPLRADAEVLWNRDAGAGNHRLGLRLEGWPEAAPGQFVMLSPGARGEVARTDPLLPRPMAVYRSSPPESGPGRAVEILYKVSGRGTGLLAEALPGQRVRVVGPLGRGFPIPEAGVRRVLVGGGTGIASLYELARRSREGGAVEVLLGGRSRVDLMGLEDFLALGVGVEAVTEDGSSEHRGLVTERLETALARGPEAVVYACGPTPMMQRCAELARGAGARCWVSLENGMACGFGVCLGCAAPHRRGGFALVCREGPVFDAEDVVWQGLA